METDGNDNMVKRAAELYKKGYTNEEIAITLGIKETLVSAYIIIAASRNLVDKKISEIPINGEKIIEGKNEPEKRINRDQDNGESIEMLYSQGMYPKEIADRFNQVPSTIYSIIDYLIKTKRMKYSSFLINNAFYKKCKEEKEKNGISINKNYFKHSETTSDPRQLIDLSDIYYTLYCISSHGKNEKDAQYYKNSSKRVLNTVMSEPRYYRYHDKAVMKMDTLEYEYLADGMRKKYINEDGKVKRDAGAIASEEGVRVSAVKEIIGTNKFFDIDHDGR